MRKNKSLSGALRANRQLRSKPDSISVFKNGEENPSRQTKAIRLLVRSFLRLARELRPTKKATFGQFILAFVSVVASAAAIWNTKLTSDSVKQLEQQRLANYRPSIYISPLELTVTARREKGGWKIEDRSEHSKVHGEEGPIKEMQLANVGKGAIQGLTFTWSYRDNASDISKFGMEIRQEDGQPALYIDGKKFVATWVEPQPSIVLPSDNEIRGVNFVADPIQFAMFDEMIEKSVRENFVASKASNFKKLGLLRGAALSLTYRNIEGSIYTQKFNFYFQPHNYMVKTDENGLINLVVYKVTVTAEPDGIEPIPRSMLGLHVQ
jgi:hypothetical protein